MQDDAYFENRSFERLDLSKERLVKAEYEQCRFAGCDMTGALLAGFSFVDCVFEQCNLSMVQLPGTAFRDVHFTGCKMLGVRFDECNAFGLSVRFDQCILDHSGFYRVKLIKTHFRDSQLHGVDFTQADLSGAVLDNCDLAGAVFDRTVLEKADLRTAYNYSIDPENNRIKKAKFSLPAVTGLLHRYQIDIS